MNKYIISLFSKERNQNWLFFFRISVGTFCLFHFLAIMPDLKNILTANAYILPDIVDSYTSHVTPTIYSFNNFLQKYLHISYNLYYFSAVYILSLISMVVGFFPRISAIIATFCHVIFLSSIDFFAYGVDFFCAMALFYCIIFPVGNQWSLSNVLLKRKDRKTDTVYANVCLTVLQAHMCIIYFFSGFDKVIGFNWWNGESIWKALHLSYSPNLVNVDALANTPVFIIAGWGTIVVEMLYPVFMNIRRTRNIWLFLVIMLHASIAVFLGLFFFSAFMIILSVSAYYIPYSRSAGKLTHIRKSFGTENSLQILYDGQCNFCRAFISKLAHLGVNSGNFDTADLRTPEARKILKDNGVTFVNLNTIYCVYDHRVTVKSKAIFLILSFARKPWCYLSYLEKLPLFITDRVYMQVAKSRYFISRFFVYV